MEGRRNTRRASIAARAASRRTRAYANRGTATRMGAAVRNRMNALLQRYGNNPRNAARIMRAGGNIMSRATVYK